MLSVGTLRLAFETRLIAFNSDRSSGARFSPSENMACFLYYCQIFRLLDLLQVYYGIVVRIVAFLLRSLPHPLVCKSALLMCFSMCTYRAVYVRFLCY